MLQILLNQLEMTFPEGISGIIFDCDGVIIDSNDINLSYYNLILKELGYPEILEEDRNYVQMISSKEALDFLISKEDQKQLPEIVKCNPYHIKALPHIKLEPGIMDLFNLLKKKGIYLGMHTNRHAKGVEEVLNHLELTEVFDPIMHVDIVPAKPHPEGITRILEAWNIEPFKVAFIGDSLTDEGATKASKVPFISYCNKDLKAEIVIESFIDLHQALNEFIGNQR